MAFNFNWSPLIADTSKAREMLTDALNKAPKPPIIVDDIIVTELNLGGTPPELEILEIGDLAEDRFRGIFKMRYSGDAFLVLRTKVQANPLNTYLSTRPSFTSPEPLAAAAGLTIPLQITLSDIRLSGFVILVFSKAKGITLVFRNDPLESLKVSSTFDSIPFVRDYLQREIEAQLRILFMDDLPAIIHRLSLRLFVPDHLSHHTDLNSNNLTAASTNSNNPNEQPTNPLATPHQGPLDALGRVLEDPEPTFSLNEDTQAHPSFSQRNLLRLAALNDSSYTLSLFTPPMRDSVFRAWAGAAERGEPSSILLPGTSLRDVTGTPSAPSLSRLHSKNNSSTSLHTYTESTTTTGGNPAGALQSSPASTSSRPSISSHPSFTSASLSGTTLGSSSTRRPGQRKRKHRVVNLRKKEPRSAEDGTDTASHPSRPTTPTSSSGGPASSYGYTGSAASDEREGEVRTPPESPEKQFQLPPMPPLHPSHRQQLQPLNLDAQTPMRVVHDPQAQFVEETPRASRLPHSSASVSSAPTTSAATARTSASVTDEIQEPSPHSKVPPSVPAWVQARLEEATGATVRANSRSRVLGRGFPASFNTGASANDGGGGILEKAWLERMRDGVEGRVGAGSVVDDEVPPAYGA